MEESTVLSLFSRIKNDFYFPYELKEEQKKALWNLLQGKNVVVVAATGFGKSDIFSLFPLMMDLKMPISHGKHIVIAIFPLKSLVEDQYRNIRAKSVSVIALLNPKDLDSQQLKGIQNGDFSVVLMTPEAILEVDHWKENILNNPIYETNVCAIVLHEAHVIAKCLGFILPGRSVFRVCDSMRELRNDCELIGSADLLTFTLLRKYMATASQMLSVNDQELHWIVKHLGDSLTVHDQYYRVMSSTLERAKIAKLLVLADQGMLGKYKGQSLEQLNFDADTKLEESQSEEMLDDSDTSDDDSLGSEGKNKVPVQRRSEKLIWSKAETNEVEEYFSEMIQDLKAPGKAESLAYLKFSKYTTNRKRTWEDVKNKVNASVQREKRRRR